MTTIQYHRPRVGEWFTRVGGVAREIAAVHYETERGVFRVSFAEPESPTGVRGCQITRASDGAAWTEYLPVIRGGTG
jgi:hypothetical protein